jgi:hypothetical protein
MILILVLNCIPLLLNFGGSLWWVLLGLAAIYIPAQMIGPEDTKK